MHELIEADLRAAGQIGVVSEEEAGEHLLGGIKAVTYHDLEIKSGPVGLQVQIVFDA